MIESEVIENKKKGVKLYASGGCIVVKRVFKTQSFATNGGIRGDISGFSPKAGQRMRKYLRGCKAKYSTMLTLTYPNEYSNDGKAIKYHLHKFMLWLHRRFDTEQKLGFVAPDIKFSAFWFLEFQARGAPHFHIFTTYHPGNESVAKNWCSIVDSGDEKHLIAGTRTEWLKKGRGGTISYASKYAAKACQKSVPEAYKNVGRFWGVRGLRVVVSADTVVSDDLAPKVSRLLDKLRSEIKLIRDRGLGKVWVWEKDCIVLFMKPNKEYKNVFRLICQIEAKMMHNRFLFADADIDIFNDGE